MNDSAFQIISNCRICGKDKLTNILDLGEQPPANSLRDNPEESLPPIPLSIVHCDQCKTVQLKETVKPEYLFSKYVDKKAHPYFSNCHFSIFSNNHHL